MVLNNQIVAIAAKNSPINFCSIVWFVYVIQVKFADHSSNKIDEYGHNVTKDVIKCLSIKQEIHFTG